jgi:glucosylceramidase
MKIIRTEKNSNKRLEEDVHIVTTTKTPTIILKPGTTFQKIIGFGGAFTEASAYNLLRVDKKVREQAIKDYFDPDEGLGYTLGRVSIHSSDFSLNSYTYIEEGDEELETFDISRDKQSIIPLIKDAQKYAGTISILASPWSPPAFMKDNNLMIFGGKLLPKYYQSWANYYVKFIEKYKEEGLNIWGITVQNEPAAKQRWDSCEYSKEEERDFVRDYLGPTLKTSPHKDVNILIWDHNRDIIVERAKAVLEDEEAAKYVWGTAFHWYVSEAFENVGKVHELFPDKGLLFTEGCQEGGVHWNSWDTGERYARNMIGDFNNYCQGYIDWNLFLDNTGGPNHVNNLCDSPVIVDVFPQKLVHQSSYYYIGHFSKYIKKNAVRIGFQNKDSDIQVTAFKNEDQSIVCILLNQTNQQKQSVVSLKEEAYKVQIEPHSIITVIL